MSHSELDYLMSGSLCQLMSFEHDRTRFCLQKPSYRMEYRRLSGAVCTDKRDDLALIDIEAYALYRGNHSVIHFKIAYFKH